jgi:hypothetical protein
MRLHQRFTFLALSALVSIPLVACGGGGDDGTGDDDDTVDPAGTHYKSVASSIQLPDETGEDMLFGLDLDKDTPHGDADYDNALGSILSALRGAAGPALDLNASLQHSIDKGQITLLADVQATSLSMAAGVGFTVYLGTIVSPAACTNPDDETTCGQHLQGTGVFTIAASSPTDSTLAGSIVGGGFSGGPGKLTLQISLVEGGAPITLDLIGAKAKLKTFSADGEITSGVLAGGITESDLNSKVIPGIATTATNVVDKETACVAHPGADCECPDGTAKTIVGLLDEDGDCKVTAEEIMANDLISTLLSPDIDLLDASGEIGSDGVEDSLSIGVGVTTVKASY